MKALAIIEIVRDSKGVVRDLVLLPKETYKTFKKSNSSAYPYVQVIDGKHVQGFRANELLVIK